MMNHITRVTFLAALSFGISFIPARAQSSTSSALNRAPGSITGRITNGDRAVAGIKVVLYPAEPTSRMKPIARAVTDPDGRFTMNGVPAGRYNVMPVAPEMVVPDTNQWPPGKPITLAPGETAENFDFQITRGGVITGRVTDADDKPVVGEQVRLEKLDASNQPQRLDFNFLPGMDTDDRGIYRIYGLPAGRYRVSAGNDANDDSFRIGGRRGFYARAFYTGTNEGSEAKIVEVSEGSEATDIDIMLGPLSQTYVVSGRVVSAETGKPVPGLSLGYGKLMGEGQHFGGYGMGIGMHTNARGDFKIDNVTPGRYATFVSMESDDSLHSDPVTFEVTDKDVSGLEVKVRQGATISGSVAIEGTSDRSTITRLMPQIHLYVNTEKPGQLSAPRWSPGRVAADGSFRLTGLSPGKARIGLDQWPPVKGLTLVRIERGGVEQKEGFELAAGEQLTGVRVVLAYGTASINGQVNIINGTLAEGTRMIVHARRHGSDTSQFRRPTAVDARGRFTIEGLAAGEYELVLGAFTNGPAAQQRVPEVRQNVTVSEGGESNVTMVVDFGQKKPEEVTP